MSLREIYDKWNSVSLILRIIVCLILGTLLALAFPKLPYLPMLGDIFIASLKATAPFLVFFIIIAALCRSQKKLGAQFKYVILLYIVSTVIAAAIAVVLNLSFPLTVTLDKMENVETVNDMEQLLTNVIMSVFSNPVTALTDGTYLSILFWAIIFGLIIKTYGHQNIIDLAQGASDIMTKVIKIVISFAPIGIFGIIYNTISENSLDIFTEYGSLILILVAAMLIVMFVTNPLLVFLSTRRNPYPLLFKCLKTSAVTAFFTRSSAANIPVNMQLAEDMKLDEDLYSVSLPLGATINMAGAAITISTMALVAANTVGQEVSPVLAFLLCFISTIAACGASGVAGGSLLLIPLACSMFGIGDEVAMQMIAIGFIIGVIQDSLETALNSSSDILFTATADIHARPDGDFNI